jgi:phosphoribosylformylglycinamidine synthase
MTNQHPVPITPELIAAHGLKPDEYRRILDLIGREPSFTELGIFSAMWNEHCSYKSSKKWLKTLPTTGPRVIQGPGENAGVVDIGDGDCVVFKMESHNHPSYIEPYQGAATGVGGILRDVFTMGARPIALLDGLRFGEPDAHFWRAVAGIGHYGNCVGVPTVGGETVFDPAYTNNCLVNAMCVGLLPAERVTRARATTPGLALVLFGATTGRDGIGGASVLASAGFDDGAQALRPSVQVGDPFEEKRLIEACLELLDARLALGVQDLGAAGLSCAAAETAANTGAGMDVDVARVAKREPGMNAVEVLTSESQERMLAIVEPGNLEQVIKLCEQWEVRATVVGRVSDTGRFRVFDGLFDAIGVDGENPPPPSPLVDAANGVSSDGGRPGHPPPALADIPCDSLGDGPVYDREQLRPAEHDTRLADDPAPLLFARFPAGSDLGPELLALLATPTVADKSWIWHQYDHQLFLNTVVGPGADATVLRLKGTPRAVALSTDGKARFCRLDPRTGARLVVLEAARNVACTGAEPRALVNCLNFGNPEHPEVMWQFAEVIDGIAEACTALGIPVVGGNVSFYNTSEGRDIDPTPVVGVVGIIDSLDAAPPGPAITPGHHVVILGATVPDLGGSEWAAVVHGLDAGSPPTADLGPAASLHGLVADLVTNRRVSAVHDVADGGLAVALTEMAIAGECGLAVVPDGDLVPAAWCFAESASRVVVTVDPVGLEEVLTRARDARVPARDAGMTGGARLVVAGALDIALADARDAWHNAIPRHFES